MNKASNNRHATVHGRVFVLAALCLLISLLLWQSQQQLTAANDPESGPPFMVEYPLPAHLPDAEPRHIIAEAPGRLWFTLPGVNALGSLVVTATVDYTFVIYAIPTANSEPHNLVLDSANQAIWFTQLAASQIGRFDLTTHQFEEFALPANTSPTGIDLDSSGMVWVALRDSNQIARLNPNTATIELFTYGVAGAAFADLAVSPANLIWMTSPGLNRLVAYEPVGQRFTFEPVVEIGLPPFPPQAIAMHGTRPWISAPTKGWLGRYAPGTFTSFLWFTTPPSASGPTGISYRGLGSTHEIWYVQSSANRAGRLLVDNGDSEIKNFVAGLPSANSQPYDIVADSNGHAWITAPGANAIAEWRPPYVVYTYLPLIRQP